MSRLQHYHALTAKSSAFAYKAGFFDRQSNRDVADGGIPVSGLLTPVSTHDSQAAIPLTYMTAEQAVNLYDLMDSAYDVPRIREISRQLGHVPLIDAFSLQS